MADQKPLVLAADPVNAGSVLMQQLQSGNDLDIPLADRVAGLEAKLGLLVNYLSAIGIEIPSELL